MHPQKREPRVRMHPQKKGSAVVLALAAGHSFADSAMLGLQLGAVAAALIALDMAARFFGCTHRGLPLARSICPWRMPGSALSVEILDGSRGGCCARGDEVRGRWGEFPRPLGKRRRRLTDFLWFSDNYQNASKLAPKSNRKAISILEAKINCETKLKRDMNSECIWDPFWDARATKN